MLNYCIKISFSNIFSKYRLCVALQDLTGCGCKVTTKISAPCCPVAFAVRICLRLTHWGRDKLATISQTTISNAFSWMKMLGFRLKFHWSFFPKGRINNIPLLVQIMAWRRPGDKPLSEPTMVRLSTHICVPRPQWVDNFILICRHQEYN